MVRGSDGRCRRSSMTSPSSARSCSTTSKRSTTDAGTKPASDTEHPSRPTLPPKRHDQTTPVSTRPGQLHPAEASARCCRVGQGHLAGDRVGKILTPDRKRSAVIMLRYRFGVSERRACKVARLHRSTQRLRTPPISDEDREIRAWLRTFSTERPRWAAARSPDGVAGRLKGQQQADPTPVARRGAPGADPAPQATHRDRRRGRCDEPDPTQRHLGARLPVRHHR